jgi:UDP-glucose 4-epimerase
MNVYGHSKLMVEQVLRDLAQSNSAWRIALLRYFNPVGAHLSGLIGEDPSGIPNNLMPFVTQVAVGKREKLSVFGDDYETVDGTGVRDYIHVDDLASGHLAALDYLDNHTGILTVNLGTGRGTSVFELLDAFERACGKKIPYEVVPRRSGDLPEYYAQADYAKAVLGWQAKYDINRMCEDSWRWQSQNPNGFES